MPQLTVLGAVNEAGNSLPAACALLWHLDRNRLEPRQHYELDFQRNSNRRTEANISRPLFKYFSRSVWERPTFKAFRRLLLCFDPRAVSLDTFEEERQFLSAICDTDCIRFAHKWLSLRGCVRAGDMRSFQEVLRRLWFTNHAISCQRATGFEHVFCGEIKHGKGKSRLNGLHNYVRVYLEEQYGNLKYLGYVAGKGEKDVTTRRNRRNGAFADKEEARGNAAPDQGRPLVTIHFLLHGHEKHVSSMFCGVSPEFEFALYTMVGLSNFGNIVVRYGDCRTNVRVILRDGKILTAYPCVQNILSDGFEGQGRLGPRELGIIDLTDENGSEQPSGNEMTKEVEIVDLTEENEVILCPSEAGEDTSPPSDDIEWEPRKRLKKAGIQSPEQSTNESATGRVIEICDDGVLQRVEDKVDVIEIAEDGPEKQDITNRRVSTRQELSAVSRQRRQRPCASVDIAASDIEKHVGARPKRAQSVPLMSDNDEYIAPDVEILSAPASEGGARKAYEVPEGKVCIDEHQHVLVTEETALEELESHREDRPVTEIESYDIDSDTGTYGNCAGSAINGTSCFHDG